MNGEVPKVLTLLAGKPMITYLLDAVEQSKICEKPVMVVGYGADRVKEALGDRCVYVVQNQQLGTGHAVSQTRSLIEGKADLVLVLYGDHPLLRSETLARAVEEHRRNGKVLTLLTSQADEFVGVHAPLYEFSRILRNAQGKMTRVVEMKDATAEQLLIREVSLAMSCFKSSWLWPHLEQLENNNKQKEYYLTDLIRIAIQEGQEIATLPVDPGECIGVNTPEHLMIAERLLSGRNL